MKIKKDILVEEFIVHLENELKLFSWRINSVYLWEIIRVNLYLEIIEKSKNGTFENNGNYTFIKGVFILFRRFFQNVILKNPFFIKNVDTVVLESGRKYLFDGNYIDIYTAFLEEQFIDKHISYKYIETNFKYDIYSDKSKATSHFDFFNFIVNVHSKLVTVSLNDNDLDLIKDIQKRIFDHFGINLDLKNVIIRKIKIFYTQRFWFDKFLKIKKVKKLFLVNYVDYFGIIAAAKLNNVKCIELQHGLIIEESLIYHFPNIKKDSLFYFPDEFYKWKNFKPITGVLPVKKILDNPYNHLEKMVDKYKKDSKDHFMILVASQPFFSSILLSYVLCNAKAMVDYQFIYKLHPMEFDSFFSSTQARDLEMLPNVKVIMNEESVYKYLGICEFVIGIYSTVLFESSMFECKPLILNIEGANYSKVLIDMCIAEELNFSTPLNSKIK